MSVLTEEIQYSSGEYRAELEMVEKQNLHPVKGLTVGILLTARNWERRTGKTLLSLSMEEILETFADWKVDGAE